MVIVYVKVTSIYQGQMDGHLSWIGQSYGYIWSCLRACLGYRVLGF